MQVIGIFLLFASLMPHQNVLGMDLTRLLGNIQTRYEAPSTNLTSTNSTTTEEGDNWNTSSQPEFRNGSTSGAIATDATLTEIVGTNSTLVETGQPTTAQSTDDPVASSSWTIVTVGNESHASSGTPGDGLSSSSSTSEASEEPEGVARGKPTTAETAMNATTPRPGKQWGRNRYGTCHTSFGIGMAETTFQKALHFINDAYTLSILLPIAAGVVFATSIFMTIATCRCLRRSCRRRRLRGKALPDSVKYLRPPDRARLLAESSDEEF